jgi:phospholipid/cholesterol/gamma-HCH transport system substrate-binding protein
MQSTRTLEIWVGIFVAVGFAALLMLSMKVSHLGSFFADEGYAVKANFENIGGLKVKSPVKMSGVRIGRVSNIQFDDDAYQAIVTMDIERQYSKIPIDASASIFTAGLLGEQYIGLKAGAEEEYLTDGDEIDSALTQSAIILEQLIGQFGLNMAANAGASED